MLDLLKVPVPLDTATAKSHLRHAQREDLHAIIRLQLTLIPGTERSSGIGSTLVRWVVERAAVDLHASLVELTSGAARADARRFYRRLDFIDSHVGFKYHVDSASYRSE